MHVVGMDALRIHNSTVRECLAEFLGTFVFIVIGQGAGLQATVTRCDQCAFYIATAYGLGVMFGVYVSIGVSGGHLNPAVSLAMSCLRKLSLSKLLFYSLAQHAGAFCGAALVYGVYTDALNDFDPLRTTTGENATAGIWSTYPADFLSWPAALCDQITGTALLLIGVMALGDPRNAGVSQAAVPPLVGVLVVAVVYAYGFNCGAALNPARDLGPRVFSSMVGYGIEPFSYRNYNWFWIPVVGPYVGAVVGAFIYELFVGLHNKEPTNEDAIVFEDSSMQGGHENCAYKEGDDDGRNDMIATSMSSEHI